MAPQPDRVPVWLLDVDGVLNVDRPGWGAAPRGGQAYSGGVGYRLRWAPELIERVAAVHRAGRAEIRWATTWVDDIAALARLFGLPDLPVAFSGVRDLSRVQIAILKAAAALRVVQTERRPLLWSDDDAIPTSGPAADLLQQAGVPVMLLRPDPRRGLQPEDLAAIEEFLTDPWQW